MLISVHQVNWHNFGGADNGSTETCQTCGGTWGYEDTPTGSKSVDRVYQANNGDAPSECPGDSREHGEAPCQAGRDGNGCEAAQDGPCQHTSHDCNCLYCG